METLLTLQVLILLLGTAIATFLTLHAWMRRPAAGSIPFALLMLTVSLWSLTYVLEVTHPTFTQKLFWAKIQYFGIVFAPVAWLLFVWEYTGRQEWINRRNVVGAIVVPIVTLLLLMTNDRHQLMWQQVSLVTTSLSTYLRMQNGGWFWVHATVSYLYLAAGSVLLAAHGLQHDTPLYRWQTAVLLTGLLLPWTGNALYLLRFSSIDLAPFAFSLAGLLLIPCVLRFRLFDISPVAYRAVVNSMKDGVLVLDRQHRIVEANSAAMQLLEPGLIGQPVKMVWPDLAQQVDGTNTSNFEVPLPYPARAPDAQPATYEVTVSYLYDWRQVPQGQLLLIRDITSRKEEEQMRNDMTHSLVHDLRAPISNSLFSLEMLQGELAQVVSADDQMLLTMTVSNTRKTLDLVNEILSIHRLESGKMPVAFSRLWLASLVEEEIAAQRPRIEDKALMLVQDMPADLPAVCADEALLARVLQNLLDNSIKFSPVGGKISISAGRAGDDQVWVSISDAGPGMEPDLQKKIFEKYVTGDNVESGSGLGLSYCQTAIKAHGQEIWVESQPGQGARFTFSLATIGENEEIR